MRDRLVAGVRPCALPIWGQNPPRVKGGPAGGRNGRKKLGASEATSLSGPRNAPMVLPRRSGLAPRAAKSPAGQMWPSRGAEWAKKTRGFGSPESFGPQKCPHGLAAECLPCTPGGNIPRGSNGAQPAGQNGRKTHAKAVVQGSRGHVGCRLNPKKNKYHTRGS